MRIIQFTSKKGDVRARKWARWLKEQKQYWDDKVCEVIFIMGFDYIARWKDGPETALLEVDPVDNCRTFLANNYAKNNGVVTTPDGTVQVNNLLQDAVMALEPNVVHLHEIDAAFPFLLDYSGGWRAQVGQGTNIIDADWTLQHPGCSLIYEAHEYEPNRPNSTPANDYERGYMEQAVCELIPNRVSVSPSICAHLGPDTHFIPNTTWAPKWSVTPRRAELRAKMGVRDDQIAVGFIGAATQDRRLDDLAMACQALGGLAVPVMIGQPMRSDHNTRRLLDAAGARWMKQQPYPFPENGVSMLDMASACDIAFNGADLTCKNWQFALPNKFFEAAMAGLYQISSPGLDVVAFQERYSLGTTYQTIFELRDKIRNAKNYRLDPLRRAAFIDDFDQGGAAMHQRMVEVYGLCPF